jgi:hypothetical protein
MSDFIEISELNFDDELKYNSNSNSGSSMKSTNFGGGIELLMNDKVKEGGNKVKSDIDLDDLNNLENELNGLVDETSSSYKPKSELFGGFNTDSSFDEKPSVRFSESPSIGQSTAQTDDNAKQWDGYGKFNNIPMNPDKNVLPQSNLSKEELLREKFKILRKLEALEKKGVEVSRKYNMESPLAEMQGEYETIMDEKSKQNSVKFQGNMLMAVINGMEFLNNRFDPFDIKLDGWSEQLNENITDYDDIFGELHEKYKSKATMAPELKLLFQLGGSAMMVHMTNTMFKSAMPGMDDILRQNPDLMRSFQNAAVNSMSQQSPGFSGFMSNMMNPEPQVPSGRGPPAPMATQGQNAVPPPQGRAGNNPFPTSKPGNNPFPTSRPDLSMGRNNYMDDGINMRENFGNTQERTQRQSRAEMKGPSDITDILSGLKTKTINIQESSAQQDSSTISISDLKDLQSDGNMPKKSGRRNKKSASNTVSLDI